MNFIENYIKGNENKWVWYLSTLIGSLLPVFFRLILSSTNNHFEPFDIKDLLFSGLAMNLSNLNLIGHKIFDIKVVLATISAILIIFISFLITAFMFLDILKGELFNVTILEILSIFLVLGSIYLSYESNNYVFKNE